LSSGGENTGIGYGLGKNETNAKLLTISPFSISYKK